MRHPGTWLLLSMLGMLLGFLGIRLASPHPDGPKPSISAQEWLTAHASPAELAAPGTPAAADREPVVATVEEAGPYGFVARFDRAQDGRPLAGVEIHLVPLGAGPEAARVATSDASGEACIKGLPAGHYLCHASHPTMVPVRSNFLPTHRVKVPGVPATASYAGVYVACFEPIGDELCKYWLTLEYEGFERSRVYPGQEFGDIHTRLRARWGRNLITFVPEAIETPDPRLELKLFFRNKGIVPASVPLVPIENFVGPTPVDVSAAADAGPAPLFELRLRDSRGRPVRSEGFTLRAGDPGSRKIAFMHSFASNEPVPVPPGSYVLSSSGMPLPWWLGMHRVELTTGQVEVLDMALPLPFREVELRRAEGAEGTAIVEVKRKEGWGDPRNRRDAGGLIYVERSVKLFLPLGENVLRISRGRSGLLLRDELHILVEDGKGPQVVMLERLPVSPVGMR